MLVNFTMVQNIFIVCGHTDMRCGIDGLANVITDKYDLDLFNGKRVIITRIEKRRPHLYTGITDEVSFLLDSFTMFLNLFCPW